MRTFALIIFGIVVVLRSTAVLADVYAFTDLDGITYFSNVPVDARYKIVISSARDPAGSKSTLNPRMLQKSASFDPIIERAAAQSDVAANLLRAVIVVESGFDENAESPKGAQGLMQLMPLTAQHYGADDAFDPTQNIHAGARYLRDLIDRYEDDLELVLAAYNAGEDAVERHGRQIPPFKETRRYVPKVLKVYKNLLALDART